MARCFGAGVDRLIDNASIGVGSPSFVDELAGSEHFKAAVEVVVLDAIQKK